MIIKNKNSHLAVIVVFICIVIISMISNPYQHYKDLIVGSLAWGYENKSLEKSGFFLFLTIMYILILFILKSSKGNEVIYAENILSRSDKLIITSLIFYIYSNYIIKDSIQWIIVYCLLIFVSSVYIEKKYSITNKSAVFNLLLLIPFSSLGLLKIINKMLKFENNIYYYTWLAIAIIQIVTMSLLIKNKNAKINKIARILQIWVPFIIFDIYGGVTYKSSVLYKNADRLIVILSVTMVMIAICYICRNDTRNDSIIWTTILSIALFFFLKCEIPLYLQDSFQVV